VRQRRRESENPQPNQTAPLRVVAFLQLCNELASGNLIRCLEGCKKWAEDIYIYDDCSEDGSQEIYPLYTNMSNVILGTVREFDKELYHKEQLLSLALASRPDWIGWIDGDVILSNALSTQCQQILGQAGNAGYDSIAVHNLNLWRHPCFFRTDNMFNDLWHIVFWKNNGNLRYEAVPGLHQLQYPSGMTHTLNLPLDQCLLHYGFASERQIARKYLTYKSYGQSGWSLERLIDEQTSFEVSRTPLNWFPDENRPHDFAGELQPISYDKYRPFCSWDEYERSSQ
jgi:hypothetical protein